MTIQPISQDDIIVWPNGTWCFRSESSQFGYLGDDYQVLPSGSADHTAWLESNQ